MGNRSAAVFLTLQLGLAGSWAASASTHPVPGTELPLAAVSAPPESTIDAAVESSRLEYAARGGSRSAYREHASLAFFSLGSLAVGGAFYGIHSSLDRPASGAASGNGTRMEMAVGTAGFTALAAAAAYLYYSLRGEVGPEVPSIGVDADGGVNAAITLPLSALLD
jgi:hypothetical protein